jgi:hypothetical protein
MDMDVEDIRVFTDIFNADELKMIENDIIVQSYKEEAEANHKKSIKFNIKIGEDIKNKLLAYNIYIGSTNELPMMWIKGDIPKHVDKVASVNHPSQFMYTNLIYITDDSNGGRLIIDEHEFPIKKGYGYRFKEGLEHETIGTDTNQMRLIIGPISEMGFPVGMSTTILYMLITPPDYFNPYYFSPDNSKFMDMSDVPPEYVPAPPLVLTGWKVFHIEDNDALYKENDIIPPGTVYNGDYSYWVYPVWESPKPPTIRELVSNRHPPAYTDNSLVFYKSHSLAPGGTAGVKNVRVKSRRT